MRDASVSSKSRDFLAPVAGISPEIHASQGIHPITPGEVNDDLDVQEAAELAHMALFQTEIDSLAVSPSTASVVVDATEQLGAEATLIDGTTTSDVTGLAIWSSDDEAVATVDDAGLVTGVTEGNATVTATYRGKSDTAAITVTAT